MSNDRFRSDFARLLTKVGDNAETVVRRFALQIGQQLISRSPVDTGRFRGNWQCGIDRIDGNTFSPPDTLGEGAAQRLKTTLGSWKPGQTINITNSLPYARRLEYGWSQQAPQGMVRLTVQDFKNHVRGASQ